MFCTPPPPLWAVRTTTTWTWWPAACRPKATGPSWRRRCAGCQRRCCRRGKTGGGAGRLAEFLAGVRRTSIEAGRYKAGWMRLSTGGRKRRAAAVAAGPGTGGELRRGGRQRWPGTGRPRGGCPPVTFWRGVSLLLPLVDCRVPIDGDGSDAGDKK